MSQFAKTVSRRKRGRKLKGKGLTRKQKAQVSSMVKAPIEKKFYDTAYVASAVSLTPAFTDITSPAEGTGMDQYTGGRIDIQSLQYRFVFTKSDTTNYIRYVIFQWFSDTTSDAPSWEKIMQNQTLGVPTTLYDITSPYVLDRGSTSSFKILVDEQFYMDAENSIQLVKGFINKGFKKTAEVYAPNSYGSNHIYLMYVSDSGVSTHPSISGFTRCRFLDS